MGEPYTRERYIPRPVACHGAPAPVTVRIPSRTSQSIRVLTSESFKLHLTPYIRVHPSPESIRVLASESLVHPSPCKPSPGLKLQPGRASLSLASESIRVPSPSESLKLHPSPSSYIRVPQVTSESFKLHPSPCPGLKTESRAEIRVPG